MSESLDSMNIETSTNNEDFTDLNSITIGMKRMDVKRKQSSLRKYQNPNQEKEKSISELNKIFSQGPCIKSPFRGVNYIIPNSVLLKFYKSLNEPYEICDFLIPKYISDNIILDLGSNFFKGEYEEDENGNLRGKCEDYNKDTELRVYFHTHQFINYSPPGSIQADIKRYNDLVTKFIPDKIDTISIYPYPSIEDIYKVIGDSKLDISYIATKLGIWEIRTYESQEIYNSYTRELTKNIKNERGELVEDINTYIKRELNTIYNDIANKYKQKYNKKLKEESYFDDEKIGYIFGPLNFLNRMKYLLGVNNIFMYTWKTFGIDIRT